MEDQGTLWIDAVYLPGIIQHLPGGRWYEAVYNPKHGRLAAARRADNGNQLTFLNAEA